MLHSNDDYNQRLNATFNHRVITIQKPEDVYILYIYMSMIMHDYVIWFHVWKRIKLRSLFSSMLGIRNLYGFSLGRDFFNYIFYSLEACTN